MLTPLPVRVYFQDTDAGGVVYHASYVNFLERTRTEWLRDCCGYSNAAYSFGFCVGKQIIPDLPRAHFILLAKLQLII